MKLSFDDGTFHRCCVSLLALACCAVGILFTTAPAAAETTAFTYQGRLSRDGGQAPDGLYDFHLNLYRGLAGASPLAAPILKTALPVTNGFFTLDRLDFGDVFDGSPRALEIGVRTNGAATFDLLSPRQLIAAAPYAIHAVSAAMATNVLSVSAAKLTGLMPLARLSGITSNQMDAGTDAAYRSVDTNVAVLRTNGYAQGLTVSNLTANAVPGVNVRLFGAKGDGVADDTAAIQAAVAYAKAHGGDVVFPPTTAAYQLSDEILLDFSGASLKGAGGIDYVRLQQTNPGKNVVCITNGANRVVLRNLWLAGAGSTVSKTASLFAYGFGYGSVDELLMENCYLTDSKYAAYFDEVSTSTFQRVAFMQCLYALWATNFCNSDEFHGCFFGICTNGVWIDKGTGWQFDSSDWGGIGTAPQTNMLVVTGGATITVIGGNMEVHGGPAAIETRGDGGAQLTLVGVAVRDYTGGANSTYSLALNDSGTWQSTVALIACDLQCVNGAYLVKRTHPYHQTVVAWPYTYPTAGFYGTQFITSFNSGLVQVEYMDSGRGHTPSDLNQFWATTYGQSSALFYGALSNGVITPVNLLSSLSNSVGAGPLASQTSVRPALGGAEAAGPLGTAQTQAGPGAVVVIDEAHPGRFKLSAHAYDPQVAGVVSGASNVHLTGLMQHRATSTETALRVISTGQVYVDADAAHGAIRPGDLLTTADHAGFAMKVADRTRAAGAILGKAMSGLEKGTGRVLVLVTLQ